MADEERPGGGWLPPSDRDREGEGTGSRPGEGSAGGPAWTSGDPLAGGSSSLPGWTPEEDPFGRRGEESGWLEQQQRQAGLTPPVSGTGGFAPPVPPGQGGFAPPPGAGAYPPPAASVSGGRESHGKATAALILGIVGIFFCPFVCSVAALVLGHQARNDMDRAPGRYGNRSAATAGIVLGWIGLALTALLLMLVVVGTLVGEAAAATGL